MIEQLRDLSHKQVFKHFLEMTGVIAAFNDDVKKHTAETGQRFGQAWSAVAKKYGFVSKKKTLEEIERIMAESDAKTILEQEAKEAERIAATAKVETYEQALEVLPETADAQLEIDWIRGHAAMSRKGRGVVDEETGLVILSAEDLLSPRGSSPAPSRAAAHMLQHFCNSPDKFYSEYGKNAMKKKTEESQGEVEKEDPGLSDVEAALESLE